MEYRSEEERRKDKEKERLERYRITNPEEYARLERLRITDSVRYTKEKLRITNPEEYRLRYPDEYARVRNPDSENEKLERYRITNPEEYARLERLRLTDSVRYAKEKLRITNPEEYAQEKERQYELPVTPSDLSADKGNAIGLKIQIENHILEKLSDYIISKHPRGNYTKNAYKIAIVNVLRNIFKDPNSDIITYIENKLKGEPENKSFFGFFGGKTKRKRRKYRKSRRT